MNNLSVVITNCLLLEGTIVSAAGGFLVASVLLYWAGWLIGLTAYWSWWKLRRVYHLSALLYGLRRLEKEGDA